MVCSMITAEFTENVTGRSPSDNFSYGSPRRSHREITARSPELVNTARGVSGVGGARWWAA